jgi:hypothetical protein
LYILDQAGAPKSPNIPASDECTKAVDKAVEAARARASLRIRFLRDMWPPYCGKRLVKPRADDRSSLVREAGKAGLHGVKKA